MTAYAHARDFLSNHRSGWLVTGAAGFIGSNLVEALLLLDQDVIGLDNFSTGQDRFIEDAAHSDRFALVRGDLLDGFSLRPAMEGIDAVYHMAANADIRGGLASPRTDLQQNTVATWGAFLASIVRQGETASKVLDTAKAIIKTDTPQAASVAASH